MQSRSLPERPNLDHLKNEAKALHKTLRAANPDVKLTDAQRQLAREYGFPTWSKLRAHVQNAGAGDDGLTAFLTAIQENARDRAQEIAAKNPRLVSGNLHVAAALGDAQNVARLAKDRSRVEEKAGHPAATPLLFLCFSPFHGQNDARDAGLFRSARILLEAGADPNAVDGRYGVSALYGVTGMHNRPGIARLLLEAGANPTDGESVFHAAENFHEDALILLREFGVQLNHVGEWGNTPLWFLLRWYDFDRNEKAAKGFDWLLANGADPNVPSGKEQETSLHVAVRQGKPASVIEKLLAHGANVDLKRADGATAWRLAKRAAYEELAQLLERSGAKREPLSSADELLGACGRGDVERAKRLSDSGLIASLAPSDQLLLNEAAAAGRTAVVRACIVAGFDVNRVNDRGATALHEAAISGYSEIVKALLEAGADHRVKDPHHDGTAMGWAQFGADFVQSADGRYEDTVRALLAAGAEVRRDEHVAEHAGVRAVLGLPPHH
jgi:ankyrin repeat protein